MMQSTGDTCSDGSGFICMYVFLSFSSYFEVKKDTLDHQRY